MELVKSRPIVLFLAIVVMLITAAIVRDTVQAQYPCCYEPPYLVQTHYFNGPNGELYVWDEYSDGRWVGTCYGCGYPWGMNLDNNNGSENVSAVIDEGGYYDVLAYGRWVFEHDIHGSHHCCTATIDSDNVVDDDLVGPITVVTEDVDEYWTDGNNYAAPDPYSSQQYGYYPTYNPWTGWSVTQCSPYYSGSEHGLIC